MSELNLSTTVSIAEVAARAQLIGQELSRLSMHAGQHGTHAQALSVRGRQYLIRPNSGEHRDHWAVGYSSPGRVSGQIARRLVTREAAFAAASCEVGVEEDYNTPALVFDQSYLEEVEAGQNKGWLAYWRLAIPFVRLGEVEIFETVDSEPVSHWANGSVLMP